MTLLYWLKSQTTDEVDYSGDVTDWMYEPESKDTVANLLVSSVTSCARVQDVSGSRRLPLSLS